MIDPVSTFTASSSLERLVHTPQVKQAKPNFMAMISELDGHIKQANQLSLDVALGQSASPTKAMMALEQVKLEMELVRQIRDKCISAYQGLLKEQI